MPTAQSSDVPPNVINGVHDVAGHHLGKTIVDVVRNSFTTGGKIQNGDDFLDRSRLLIQQYHPVLPNDDQGAIQNGLQR